MDEEEYIEDEELEKGSDIERVRTILADEEDGSGVLDQIINESNDPRVREVFQAIKEDEQKHVAALQQLAEILGSGEGDESEGAEEDGPEPEDEGEEEYDYAEGDEPADLDLDNAPEGDLSVDLGDIPGDEEEDEDLDKEDAAGDLIDDIREVLAEHEAEKAEGDPEDEEDEDEDLPDFLKEDDDEEEDEDEVSKVMKAYNVPIIVSKAADQQIVYGVVSEPNVIDLQGDRLSKSEIRAACHKFMQTGQRIGKEHSGVAKASIIESYIAPTDFKCNGQVVKSGSWVMAVKIHDPALWQAVKKGDITGFSIAGTGTRTPF